MSTPAPTLPDTPQEAIGIPDNPLGRFPTIAGRNASRRRSRGPGGGLPSNPLRGHTPRTPGTLSPSERRAQAKQRLTVVRPESKPKSSEGMTAQGAPTRNPREIPKTGKAREAREAIRHGMSKDTRRFHEGLSARAQDAFNKETRAHQDIVRRDLDDEIVLALRAHREHALREARDRRRPMTEADRQAQQKRKSEVADIMRDLRTGKDTPDEG